MAYKVDKKYIGIEDLGCELSHIKSLLGVIYEEFFEMTQEEAMKNPAVALYNYNAYRDMTSVTLGLVVESQETCKIVEENIREKQMKYQKIKETVTA